jgi:CelD/BcsL family acetyltransferase involved in cellulose biosynthesis
MTAEASMQLLSPMGTPASTLNAYCSHALPDLQCEVVTDFARLEKVSADWEQLSQSSGSEVFQKFAWTRAFWRTWRSRFSLCSLLIHDSATIHGILPVASDGKEIRFLAEGDYNDLICEEQSAPSVLATAIRALLKIPGVPASCILRNLSVDSRIVRHLRSLPKEFQKKVILSFAYPCPSIVTDGDPRIFAKAALKESLRRHENKLRREGQVTFRHIESRREIHEYLPGFFEQQIARRALLGQNSHFQDPAERAFYGALVDELDPRSDLRFSVLELDERPVAYHFGFQARGKLIWYQSSFDVDLWHCSPGEVLIRKLLEYADERGLREFDLTVGGELYKSRFANVIRNNFNLHVERQLPGLTAQSRRLSVLISGNGRQIREKTKASPRLYKALKHIWMGSADFISQERRLIHRVGLLHYAKLAFRALLRNVIFDKREVLLFSIKRNELAREGPLSSSAGCLEVHAGSLSELALLSLEYPDDFRRSSLHSCRKRLTAGDRIYSVRLNRELVHLAWSVEQPTLATEGGVRYDIPINGPVAVIEDFWTAPTFTQSHSLPQAIQLLIYKSQGNHGPRTYYVTLHKEACQQMEAADFRLSHRVLQIRFLHVFRWSLTTPSRNVEIATKQRPSERSSQG